MRGGRREGAGRPQGARNKRTVEAEEAMKAVVQEFSAAVPDAFAGDAVAFLQTIYKDPRIPLRARLNAAAKAARFERPTSATNDTHFIPGIEAQTDEELVAALSKP